MKKEIDVVLMCEIFVDSIYSDMKENPVTCERTIKNYHNLYYYYFTLAKDIENEIIQMENCDLKKSYNNARINDTLNFFKKDMGFGTSEIKQDFRETILSFITEYYDNKVNKNADRKQHLALFIINAINYFTKKDKQIDDNNKGKLTILKNN